MEPSLVGVEPVRRWLTWANSLTAARLLAAPLLAIAILGGRTSLAFGLFAFAVATDFADGRVARLRGEVSRLGGFLDHAVDATFVVVGLAALAHAGLVPVALPPAIAAAFLQYALDSRIVSGGRLRASALGRWNGILYYVLLGVPVVRDGLGLGFPTDPVVRALGWLLVLTTLASIADRALLLRRR